MTSGQKGDFRDRPSLLSRMPMSWRGCEPFWAVASSPHSIRSWKRGHTFQRKAIPWFAVSCQNRGRFIADQRAPDLACRLQ